MNCKDLILTVFKPTLADKAARFLQEAQQSFNSLLSDGANQCRVVEWEEFTSSVLANPANLGICFGGSGVQQSIALNQTRGIRAALTHTSYIARMCREHNDANVVIIPMDCVGDKLGGSLVREFLASGFDGQPKNRLRIDKMMAFEVQTQ